MMYRHRRLRRLAGVPLLGFADAFEDVRGSAETPTPYPIVIPARVGPVLLPFSCPHCAADCSALVDPDKRLHYYDAERKFSWCPEPACRKRFFVDRQGMPLQEDLPAGATVAPSVIENARDLLEAGQQSVGKASAPRALVGACMCQRGLEMLGALAA